MLAKPYDYNCDCKYDNSNGYKGRQSEVLFNGEMHNLYEAIKHLTDYPYKKEVTPVAKHRGALWLDQRTNQLYSWVGLGYKHDKVRNGWLPIFSDKFQMFEDILSDMPSASPVAGQLWLYNSVLMYFDGSSWQPVKTLEHSDSQFNVSMFSDYQIVSPLNRIGSTVISDFELEAFLELQQRYFEGDVDLMNHADAQIDKRWNWNSVKKKGVIDFDLEDITYQYLVPDMQADRIFMDDRLDTNYTLQNNNVIQYKRSYLLDEQPVYDDSTPLTAHVKVPTMIHVNPGKLSGVKKRLFKVDRLNPKICCPAVNTEYYGFCTGDIRGHFLRPRKDVSQALEEHRRMLADMSEEGKVALNEELKQHGYTVDSLFTDETDHDTGDYEKLPDGIFLSQQASQTYDYILAVTFEFSWMNATGKLRQGDNRNLSCSFYIPDRLGSTNIFINGFDYESNYYSWDYQNKVVTVAEDISDKDNFDISVLGVFAHEYGYIREVNITADNQKAHISTVKQFLHPLIFVNGEVLLRCQWQYYDRNLLEETETPGTAFSITGVRKDMCWTVIDMYKEEPVYDITGKQTDTRIVDICLEDNGYIPYHDFYSDSSGNPAIPIPEGYSVIYEDIPNVPFYKLPHVVLFVNGLMVRREDVRYDPIKNVITCEGLKCGMHYVLLDDKEGNLYTEEMADGIKPAISIGKIDATLVYHNGYLLNEEKSYLFEGQEEQATYVAIHGEIKAFDFGNSWKVFDTNVKSNKIGLKGVWRDLDEQTISDIKSFSNSYVSSNTAVALADTISDKDNVTVFGYQLANYVENPTIPVTCWLHLGDNGRTFLKEAGYDEAYLKIIQSDKADVVYLHKIDPANPEIIENYQKQKHAFYYFLIRAFNLWKRERGFDENTVTVAEMISEYQSDARKHPDLFASYLTGYFYDEVYMKTKADEETYLRLKEIAKGFLWVNKIFLGKNYNPVTDYVMVWINGVRQYPGINYVISPVYTDEILKGYNLVLGKYDGDNLVETVDENGYVDVPIGEGNGIDPTMAKEPLTGILTYVIQRAEGGESKACSYKILNNEHMVEGAQNVYTTRDKRKDIIVDDMDEEYFSREIEGDFSLYPGNVTIYADGVRLPKSAYTVIDNYTFVIHDNYPWCGGSRYPDEMYLDYYKQLKNTRHLRPEELLVEVRQNSAWTERTVSVNKTFYGDINLFTKDNDIPANILDTQDTVMIFVNGLYYGLTLNNGYTFDKTAGLISVKDGSIISTLRKDDINDYLAKYPAMEYYYAKELAVYRARQAEKLHQITLEWR